MSAPETAAEQINFLNSLRAVRNFRPDQVPQAVIDDLLRVARWSGSASNRQPWEFVIVRDRATLQALSRVAGYAGHLANAPLGIVLVMAGEPTRAEQETYDEGRLAERIMLAAQAHGLGSCIGWAIEQGADEVKAMLGIPASRRVRTLLSIGYPDTVAQSARPRPPEARKALRKLVHYERYGSPDERNA